MENTQLNNLPQLDKCSIEYQQVLKHFAITTNKLLDKQIQTNLKISAQLQNIINFINNNY